MKKKIPTYLFVIPWSLDHVGGVNQVVKSLAYEMKKSGSYDPIVLICDWAAKTPIWGVSHGLKIVRWRVWPHHTNVRLKEKIGFWFWSRNFYSLFFRFCAENNVAVINFHYPGQFSFALERVARGCPNAPALVFSFHGSDIVSIEHSDVTALVEWKRLLQRSDGVVACSISLGQRISEIFDNDVPVCIVQNGIDLESFAASATHRKSTLRRIILSVGKFDYIKGQDILIRAFSSIAKHYDDVDLVLVGATGKALPMLKKLCLDEGVVERVKFHHDVPHENMSNFYAEASVFVLPSRTEAFGLVIMEAAAFFLPVVASRIGGIPETVIDGQTGRLVTAEDPSQLALSIQWVLDNPVEAKKLGENLQSLVGSRFTWPAACKVYYELVGKNASLGRSIIDPASVCRT